ncbi:MAG: hypothetical protein KGK07_07595 [Chloroflexota bacterium]|nr:hypothetical protein [Chloroflexota bacterium]
MRTISAALLAAQQSASAEPAVQAVAYNMQAGVIRLDFTTADATANPIRRHGAAVAGDGSLTRVSMDTGAVLTNRSPAPDTAISTGWSIQQSNKGTQIAVCAAGARVAVAYTDAAGTGLKIIESSDYGATYAAEVAVATAPAAVAGLAAAYRDSGGDMAIAWIEAAALRIVKRTAGVWGAPSASPAVVSSYNGIGMTFVFDWNIAVTGVEATTLKPTLWTTTYGDGIDVPANTWGAAYVQQQTEADAQVTYRAPFLAYISTYRLTFVEADAFAGGATRTYRSHLIYPLVWTSGPYTWRTPAPVDYTQTEGLALAAGTSWAFESAPDHVHRASRALVTADLSAELIAADVRESAFDTTGYIEIDNSDGAYAGPPAPLAVGNLVRLSWGYKTPATDTSTMADLWIAGFEYRRTGGISTLRLVLAGGWAQLRRDRQRTSIFHAAGSASYGQILTRLMARAGINLTTSGASARQGAVFPAFQIAPTTDAHTATRQLLDFIADRIIMRTGTAVLTEPLATAPSVYTFGGAHAVYEARIAVEPPQASEAHAFGAAVFGEAIDFAAAQAYIGTRVIRRDLTSTTPAQAAATAAAHLRQRALDEPGGTLTVPPACGLELLDVLDITDPLIAAAAVKRRVQAILWRWDAPAGHYEQVISLGAV